MYAPSHLVAVVARAAFCFPDPFVFGERRTQGGHCMLSDVSLCHPCRCPSVVVLRRPSSSLSVVVVERTLGALLLLKRTLGVRCFVCSPPCFRNAITLSWRSPDLSPVSQISTDRSRPGTVYSVGRSSTYYCVSFEISTRRFSMRVAMLYTVHRSGIDTTKRCTAWFSHE